MRLVPGGNMPGENLPGGNMPDMREWSEAIARLEDAAVCPGCFATLSGYVCGSCGLDVSDPRAPEVLAAGKVIVGWERERQRLIGEIRASSARARAEAQAARIHSLQEPELPVVSAAPASPEPFYTSTPAPAGVGDGPANVDTAASVDSPTPPPAVARPPRRRLSVQALLLIVGVSLVSVAAIFFVVFAWFVAGVGVRALIIGAITVATIAAATLLRRRSLTATAEGIATLGVVLLALDTWAAHANNLFGLGATDPVVYAGAAALALGIGCRVWAAFSKLRAPDVAAAFATLSGVGLLVGGLSSLTPLAATIAGLLGAGGAGLMHALPRPWSSARTGEAAVPERIALAAGGIGAVAVAALLAPFITSGGVPATLWATPVVALLGLSHAWILSRVNALLPGAGVLGGVAAVAAVASAGTLGWQLAWRENSPLLAFLLAPIAAVVVWILTDRVSSRAASAGKTPLAVRAGAVAGAAVAAMSIAASIVLWAISASVGLSTWTLWFTDPFVFAGESHSWAAPVAAAVIVAALFVAQGPWGVHLRTIRPILAAIVVLTAGATPGIPVALVVASAIVAAGALVALSRGADRETWGTAAALGAISAPFAGLTTPWLWLVGVAIAIITPIAALILTRVGGLAATLLTLTPVAVAVAAALAAPAPLHAVLGGAVAPPDSRFVALQWVAVVTIACALFLRVPEHSRSALAYVGYGVFFVSLIGVTLAPSTPGEPIGALVRTALVLGLAVYVIVGRPRLGTAAALVATSTAGPAAAALCVAVAHTSGAAWTEGVALVAMCAATLISVLCAVFVLVGRQPTARMGVDIGVVVTLAVCSFGVTWSHAWAAAAAIALAIAAASVSSGWAAPRELAIPGVFTAGSAGMPFPAAPRRVLIWPAAIAATMSLWLWLWWAMPDDALPSPEAFLVPPAVAMLVWAVVLVWLRRSYEATLAVTLGILAGLVAPAIRDWDGYTTPRELIVAGIAAGLCIIATCTPLARAAAPATAAAATSLVAVGAVVTDHTLGWWRPEIETFSVTTGALLFALPAVAFASAFGATRAGRAPQLLGYGAVAPALALLVTATATLTSTQFFVVALIAIVAFCAIHVVAAATNRDPLGAATRWSAIVAAAMVSAAASLEHNQTAIEAFSVPLAAALLIGAVLALRRRPLSPVQIAPALTPAAVAAPTPGAVDRGAWVVGLIVGFGPSLLAEWNDTRAWLVIVLALAAAVVACFVQLPDRLHERTVGFTAAAALLMGARAAIDSWAGPIGSVMAVLAALGVLAVAALLTARAQIGEHRGLATALAGGVVTTLGAAAMMGPYSTASTALTIGVAGVIAVCGASALALDRWWHLGATVAVGGVVLAELAAMRSVVMALGIRSSGIDADVWMLAATTIVFAVAIAAIRAKDVAHVTITARWAMSAAVVIFALTEWLLISEQAAYGLTDLRAVGTMVVISAAGVAGHMMAPRLGKALFVTSAIVAALFGSLMLMSEPVTAVELVTVAPAIGLLVIGARMLRLDASVRSWPALGPGLGLLLVPSLLMDFAPAELWRVLALGVAALLAIVVGAVTKLQAPLVMGSAVLLIHGVAQLWPWIVDVYLFVPWWLWLGLGGALLIFLAARYEKQARALRTAFTAVTSLR